MLLTITPMVCHADWGWGNGGGSSNFNPAAVAITGGTVTGLTSVQAKDPIRDVRAYGAKCDVTYLADGVTNGTTTFISATANFTGRQGEAIALLGGGALISVPSPPSLAVKGTVGSTTYYYKITGTTSVGETTASTAASIATGNATLTSVNYIQLTLTAISPYATGFHIYKSTDGTNYYLINSAFSRTVTLWRKLSGTSAKVP